MVTCLSARRSESGLIASDAELSRSMYAHGFSMLFLSQAYGMENHPLRQQRISNTLGPAVRLTARAQSPDGGWVYSPVSVGDEGSVTVTQMQALRACRDVGLAVPRGTIEAAASYIKKCQNDDGGICYSLRNRGGTSTPAVTAASCVTLYSAGEFQGDTAHKCIAFTKRTLKQAEGAFFAAYPRHSFYCLFYVAQTMWLLGDDEWNVFFPPLRDALIAMQQEDGSWPGNVGPVFSTSIALVVLQLPYKHVPVFQR
jgi:hypothetical protein